MQAGRWSEVARLLGFIALNAMRIGVVIADSDIGWLADPQPFIARAKLAHPDVDLLLPTDLVIHELQRRRIGVAPSSNASWGDAELLELEEPARSLGSMSVGPSAQSLLNVGLLVCYLHEATRAHALVATLEQWAEAVVTGGGGRRRGKKGAAASQAALLPTDLAEWDQRAPQRARAEGCPSPCAPDGPGSTRAARAH